MSNPRIAKARRLSAEGCFSEALYIWRDVCALEPPCAGHRVEMAACLAELGADDEAIFELETALALDSSVMARIEADVRFSVLLSSL